MTENIKKIQEFFNHLDLRAYNHNFDLELYLTHIINKIEMDSDFGGDGNIDWTDSLWQCTVLRRCRNTISNSMRLIHEIEDKIDELRKEKEEKTKKEN
jgi:hypothetical protein